MQLMTCRFCPGGGFEVGNLDTFTESRKSSTVTLSFTSFMRLKYHSMTTRKRKNWNEAELMSLNVETLENSTSIK